MSGFYQTWPPKTVSGTSTGPTSSGTAFIQNGNAFGATAQLGTIDNNPLNIITNNSVNMTFLPNGMIGIGTTLPASRIDIEDTVTGTSSYNSFTDNVTVNPAGLSTALYRGTFSAINWSSGSNLNPGGSVIGGEYAASISSPITADSVVGLVGNTVNFFTGIVTNATGVIGKVVNASTGTMSNVNAANFFISNTGGGVITTGFGVNIGTIQATTKWSLYASDATAPSFFAGNVGIGTAPISHTLEVVGTINASGNITGLNLSGTNTGNVTIGTANGLSLASQSLSMATANGSTTGTLLLTDWVTFNSKQAGPLTGDLTTTSSGTATTLATVNGNVGSFTNANITVNAKGLVTAAANGSAGASTAPTVQSFSSGSGIYTRPTGPTPLYIKIVAVGGGGGGGGSGTSIGSLSTAGGSTTFGSGSALISCGGGGPGTMNLTFGGSGGAGGTSTLGTGPLGLSVVGGAGSPGDSFGLSSANIPGSPGASSYLGAAGAAGLDTGPGGNAGANSGSGGGSAGLNSVGSAVIGGTGGAGGYAEALITSPASTYVWAVGTGGTGSGAGVNGQAGGSGGQGRIIVYEFYQ